jgi:adenine/guanine phosphoribosyltransferase-like PRPP-binding protein
VVRREKVNEMRVSIGTDPTVHRLLARYHSAVEVVDRAGTPGVGVTNLKRMFGQPAELRVLVRALGASLLDAEALAAADTGAAPLTAALAFHVGLPAVFVRSTAKTHFLSYGGEPDHNHPRLSGERLSAGTNVVIVDDLLHSGQTVVAAAQTLREVDASVSSAACLLAAPPAAWQTRLGGAGFQTVDALALTTDLRE